MHGNHWGMHSMHLEGSEQWLLCERTYLDEAQTSMHVDRDTSFSRQRLQMLPLWWLQAMGIQRYIFFSIHNAERHPEVPLMLIKSCTEKFLEGSGLDFTIFRLCGFMQAIIGNYAVPILEDRQVWGTSDQTQTAYLDSQVSASGFRVQGSRGLKQGGFIC